MKSKIFILALFVASIVILSGAFAQDDDKGKDKNKEKSGKANVHFKVDKNSIPRNVLPGETFTINVDVSNKSKSTDWNSDNLTFEVDPPYTFTGTLLSKLSLGPGEYGTIQVNIRAPETEGKQLLKLTASDNGKKSKQFVKNITVGASKIKDKDDDGTKSDDKNKEKNKDKNKNREKDKDKNKEKNKKND